MEPSTVREECRQYHAAGFSAVPANAERKFPTAAWADAQDAIPDDDELDAFPDGDAVAVVCGFVSGGLWVLDFDQEGRAYAGFHRRLREVLGDEFADRLCVIETPSGGRHLWFRTWDGFAPGNEKLAVNESGVLIETRGEGGLVIAPPSKGYRRIHGTGPLKLEDGQADTIYAIAAEFDRSPEVDHLAVERPARLEGESAGSLPGHQFNHTGDIRVTLEAHGWTHVGTARGNELWRRPGKESGGHSATLRNVDGMDLFYVHSSNAPIPAGRAYTPFQVRTLFEFGGDFRACARFLVDEEGYQFPDPTAAALSRAMDRFAPEDEDETPWRIVPATDLLADESLSLNPPLIEGLLRFGEVANIVASPKVGKSWFVLQLAISIVAGREFLGRRCGSVSDRVLLVDNELHPSVMRARLRMIAEAMDVGASDLSNLHVCSLKGRNRGVDDLFVEFADAGMPKHYYSAVIVDALYRALPNGVEENANEDIRQVYDLLDRFALASGSALLLVHHASKGTQTDKRITDVGSGAGSMSRAADTHLVLLEHDEPDHVVIDAAVRSFPPVRRCVAKNHRPLFEVDPTLDPALLAGSPAVAARDREEQSVVVREEALAAIREYLATSTVPRAASAITDAVFVARGIPGKTNVNGFLLALYESGDIVPVDPKKGIVLDHVPESVPRKCTHRWIASDALKSKFGIS